MWRYRDRQRVAAAAYRATGWSSTGIKIAHGGSFSAVGPGSRQGCAHGSDISCRWSPSPRAFWSLSEARATASQPCHSRGQRCFSSEADAAEAAQATQQAAAETARQNAVVLSKRLPEDFIESTLMPHLESQLLSNIHIYTPAELCKIARAYSKQNPRQFALCEKLGHTVLFRMVGFEAVDLVDIVGPLWQLLPGDDEVWEGLEKHVLLKIDDFTALNLIGIIRIFNKRATKHTDLMTAAMPRLRELLKEYEAVELTDMLMSIAQAKEAAQDMDILMTLVPEIERRYSEVSLVHAINNVWALTQLKVAHQGLLRKVADDLANTTRTKDLTPAYMSRIVWIYRRCNAWDMVSENLLPLIKSASAEFRCGDFARLAQALPEERHLLKRIADLLRKDLVEMGRKDFMLFFLGCVHGELVEEEKSRLDDFLEANPECLLAQLISYLREEQDNFKREEVEKIVYLLRYSPKYQHLLDVLPASWNATKEETLDYIRAKGS
eukprot:TRINITY_DN80205_c0_g1_i1.p1 TRINITY_DN80205_c0_g1~~TRINITY_DN80205_c0_g1_i1.p1  ORF type:complete len:494 (+),score=111.39 TRINITY_DN80205_c0_g1_i1:96-1577(+)